VTLMAIPLAIAGFSLFDELSRWLCKFDKDMAEGDDFPRFRWICWGKSCPEHYSDASRHLIIALPSFDMIPSEWGRGPYKWAQRIVFIRKRSSLRPGFARLCWRYA
jgi:hypothetical protein